MTKRALIVLGWLMAAALPLSPEIFYPWQGTYIGALDAAGWPGLVIAPAADAAFAFVLRVEREGEAAEGADLFYLVSEVGAHSPDGLHARMRFDLGLPFKMGRATPILMKPSPRRTALVIEWSRRDEKTVVGRIDCPADARVSLVFYLPWRGQGDLEVLPDGQVRGRSAGPSGWSFRVWTSRPAEAADAPPGGLARSFPPSERPIAFAAGVDADDRRLADRLYRYKNADTIGALLTEETAVYEEKRVKIRGLFAGVPEAITNSLHWNILYQPGHHRLYAPAGRNWIFPRPEGGQDDWTIFCGGAFLSALGLALESQKLALDALRAVLETQYPNGNIPNWRGRSSGSADRSQPPIGAYVVLKLFERLGDLEILRSAYPNLQRWHDFWTAPSRTGGPPRRDGNGDGLLEWGSDKELVGKSVPSWERSAPGRMRAGWESGQDDLPSWDDVPFNEETGTLAMNCVDLNSLYALDAWSLGEIAAVLGRPLDAERYRREYDRLRALVNAVLWNEQDGFYYDRFWDGRFSVHRAASSFYSLLAGIPDEGRARRMLKHLLDPKKFWGDFIIPSISRDDPAFRPGSQQSWRGAIRPATNYLVYQGLKAYGFDAVASEFARKSAEMFLRGWKSFGLSPEDFDSLTGEAGGDRYQSGGPLAALIAVEEYLDFTPHEGFRFGMLQPDAKGKLSRVLVQGRHYEVEVANSATVLREEGETILSVDGSAVVRRFLYSESEVSFALKALGNREVKLRLLKKGKYQLLLDGRVVAVFTGSGRKFTVPEGDHIILVQLLEDLERQAGGGSAG
jgi:hypothetical protein